MLGIIIRLEIIFPLLPLDNEVELVHSDEFFLDFNWLDQFSQQDARTNGEIWIDGALVMMWVNFRTKLNTRLYVHTNTLMAL